MMRLDKLVAGAARLTRKEASAAIRAKRVFVNGSAALSGDVKVDENADAVTLDGERLSYREFVYFMLNKPEGYVSSTDDPSGPTVLELLPERARAGLFPCGRLDRNTTGLLILTNDGKTAHALLSPKRHVEKTYFFAVARPVTAQDIAELERGVNIGVCVTKPCRIEMQDETHGYITLTEGKYHQIKEMFKNRMNKVLRLRRVAFGGVRLDGDLGEGAYRPLTPDETAELKKRAGAEITSTGKTIRGKEWTSSNNSQKN